MAQDDTNMTDVAANPEYEHRFDDLKRTFQEGFNSLDRSIKDGIIQVTGSIHNEFESQFSTTRIESGTTTVCQNSQTI